MITAALKNLEYIEQVVPEEIFIEKSAYQTTLEREVLVRFLSPGAADNSKLRASFLREMRALASLSHPNLAHVCDAGMEEGRPYLVLQKPDGVTLSRRINILNGQRSRMEVQEALQIVSDISEAVACANTRNAHLQSLTPDQIILTTDRRAVLTGFGYPIPENILSASPSSLAYAPPERIHGGEIDNRSDVYNLGVLLYHLLFGRPPFEGDAWDIILQKRSAESLPALDDPDTLSHCPKPLVDVIRQATAQQLDHRYDDADMFRNVLSEILRRMEASSASNGHKPSNGTNGTAHTTPKPSNGSGMIGFTKANNAYPSHNGPGTWNYRPIPSPNGSKNSHDWPGTELKLAEKNNGIKMTDIDVQFAEVDHPSRSSSPVSPAPVSLSDTVESGLEDSLGEYTDEADTVQQTKIDPLMPGFGNPVLQAALPFTTLVPMPDANERPKAGIDHASVPPERRSSVNYVWLLGMGLLGAISIMIAIKFG